MNSRLFKGTVWHRRLSPADHAFRYRTSYVLLDLAEVEEALSHGWLASARRPALARFRRSDYLGDADTDLSSAVTNRIREEHPEAEVASIRLLTHLRYFGYCFNPVSFYYCYDAEGALAFIVAEITNTPWGERHAYVLDARTQAGQSSLSFEFAKRFHVSPFMPMDLRYRWQFSADGGANHENGVLSVNMENWRDGQVMFKARYVIGGHRNRMKDMMVHSATSLQPQSIRLLLALAAMFGFNIRTADVR